MKGTIWPRPYEKDPETGARKPVKGSTWTWQFAVPKTGGSGRRQLSKGGYRTKREAEAALAEALAEYGQAPGVDRAEPSKMALSVYLRDEWLPTLHSLKPSTRRGYQDLVNAYVVPYLGDVRLCDLTAGQIAKLYDRLRTSGRVRNGSGLSESSVHHVHVALSAALGHAVEARFLRFSPITQLARKARPKATSEAKPEMKVWSPVECRTFLATAKDDRLGAMYDLALNTGMRRGELVGLRWGDVDLEAGRLAVRRNRTTVGYGVEGGTPKGKRARVIDLDPPTVAALRSHRAAQASERLAWGPSWTDSGLVFTREDGSPLHPQTATWHLRRLSRKAGVPEVRLHDLRHTHATLGLASGVPAKVMQERLGHASVQITLDLYSHVVPGMGADAASRIGALLRGVQ